MFTVKQAADVLHESGTETTRQLLDCLSVAEIGDVLNEMPMDEVARVLTRGVPERQEELLAAMEPPDAAEVRDLLQYPPESAGRLMTEMFVRVRLPSLPSRIAGSKALDLVESFLFCRTRSG